MEDNNVRQLEMGLSIDINRLSKLLRDFYTLTKIKISFYDTKFNQIDSFPLENCTFCSEFRKTNSSICARSDKAGFLHCAQNGRTHVYECPAGLLEIIVPLTTNDHVIGYIMFGQLIRSEGKTRTFERLQKSHVELTENESTLLELIHGITVKSREELDAAKTIGTACVRYLLYDKIISMNQNNLIYNIDAYINDNMEYGISVNDLCDYMHMKRSTFYNVVQEKLGCSIGNYIQKRRLDAIKNYLSDTDWSITKIAEKTGFNDYNYFLKYFKKHTGTTCRLYRREHQNSN